MARVKRGVTSRRRHKRVLRLAKGFYGAKSRWFKLANQYVIRALAAAYRDRRARKRDFRRLWIARINAAARTNGVSYSRLISGLRKAGVSVNRKMLADLAVEGSAAYAGAFLLSLPVASAAGRPVPFLTALFTATSATCVTGLVVVDTATYFSLFGQLVIMLLIQLGGLGYMTVATLMAMLIGRRIGLRDRLVLQEAHNLYTIGGVVRFTRTVVLATLAIETGGALIPAWRWVS